MAQLFLNQTTWLILWLSFGLVVLLVVGIVVGALFRFRRRRAARRGFEVRGKDGK